MDLMSSFEKIMTMDEHSWACHANPWSVYTRFTLLPIISIAVWSREWIGAYSLLAIALAIFWTWLNPRAFIPPAKTNNWASMGTFGERIYLERKKRQIPSHHINAAISLQVLTAIGLPFFILGLYHLNFWLLVLGNIWLMLCKAWFVDRMVWLYRDMKDSDTTYQSWLKT